MRVNFLYATAGVFCVALALLPPAAATPVSSETLCGGLTWPRPMPAVIGLTVDPLSNAPQPLSCLENLTLVGPAGKASAGTAAGSLLRIASVSPSPGTPVRADDPVRVDLVAVDQGSPPAYRPCDWVSTTEAADFLDQAPVALSAKGIEQGSTDIRCDYSFNETPDRSADRRSVSSELRLTDAHVVDAASEFAATTADDSAAVEGIGVKAACTPLSTSVASKPVHRLTVLLPAERLYLATGWGGETCDTLEQFAHAAIPRIGA